MRIGLLLLALLLLGAAAPRAPCPQPSEFQCGIGDPAAIRFTGGIETLERVIHVRPDSLPLQRPLVVRIAALASAEVSWNGTVVGRNGVPAEDDANEVPGLYYSTVIVPSALVRPGDNAVIVRLSAHRLWLPVRRPVHIVDVGPYETPELPGRSDYLPALLALGAIAAAFAYFAAAARLRARGAAQIAGFAAATSLQLLVEVSRAYFAFTYPWALGRVTAVALLAAAAAVLMASYAAGRFAPGRRRLLLGIAATAATASVVLIPWFDFKALGAILAGTLVLAAAAALGVRGRIPGARWAAAAAAVICAAMIVEATAFLDQAWFVIAAALLVLVVEQIGQLRAARAEAARAALLEARLLRAETSGEPILQLKDGSRVHRVAQGDILFARGADDYSEVLLKDGRVLLVTTGLARLEKALPVSFVRVHKSYVVNRDCVLRMEPRPGGGQRLALDGGLTIPVGRSYAGRIALA